MLVTVGATPESSVAVGAVHVTATPLEPRGIATLMSDGQPEMTGAVLSPEAVQENTEWHWVLGRL